MFATSSDRMYQDILPGTHECHNANRDLTEKKQKARVAIWGNQRADKLASMFVCCVCTLRNKNGNPGIHWPRQIRQGQASRAGKRTRMAILNAGYWATLGKNRQVHYVLILEYRLLAAGLSKYRQV